MLESSFKGLGILLVYMASVLLLHWAIYYTPKSLALISAPLGLVLATLVTKLSVKDAVYEFLPITYRDSRVLVKWFIDNNKAWLRFCINSALSLTRVIFSILTMHWKQLCVFFIGLFGSYHLSENVEVGSGASLWLVMFGMYLIFTNLGKREEGDLSSCVYVRVNFGGPNVYATAIGFNAMWFMLKA